jgi:holo-[acyl-carrier protein] synthase
MLRTGVDLVEIERVRRVMARSGERFLARIFTPQEQAYCQGRIASLAGRFAVKEAVAKALGTGIGDVTWVEIEIVSDKMGRPELVLHGAAKEAADALGLVEWSISLSHTEQYAIGFAAAVGKSLT